LIGAARVADVEENNDPCAEEEFGKTDAENTEEKSYYRRGRDSLNEGI
jgi:hypothetical protein